MRRIYLLRLLRVPHGRLEGGALTLVTFLAGQDEADVALVQEAVPSVVEDHKTVHAGPAVRAPLWFLEVD